MKIYTFFLIVLSFACSQLMGQQRHMLNHETASPLYYNPGVVTMMGENKVSLIHRSQFIGDRGPTTQGLVVAGRLPSGLSLGGYLTNDIAGPIQRLSFRFSASYNIVETKKHTMGLGIYLGLLNQSLKTGEFNVFDPLINSSEQIPFTNLDAGIGFHYQYEWDGNANVSFGVASVQLPQSFELESSIGDPSTFDFPLHLLINLAATIPVSDQIAIEPQTLFRPLPGQYNLKGGIADVYLNLYFFQNELRFGLGGRLDKTSALLFRVSGNISDKLSASVFGEVHSQWGPSLEVGVSYVIGNTEVIFEDNPRPIKPDKPTKEEPLVEAFWERRSVLKSRAAGLTSAPSNLTINSALGSDITINYQFADEENIYDLNNSAPVSVVINDIKDLLDDASSSVRKFRLSELKEVEIAIYSPQSIGELEYLDGPKPYNGEFGSPITLEYNDFKKEEIEKGTINELEFLLLKMEAIKRMFKERGLTPTFKYKILEFKESKEILIKLTIKKED